MSCKVISNDSYKEHGIETMMFPGGEPHVKVPKFNEKVLPVLRLRTWEDVGYAALLLDALARQGVVDRVFIPYFPGARQDRSDGTCGLTALVMSKLLNLHQFDYEVYSLDIHSPFLTSHGIRNIHVAHLMVHLSNMEEVVGVIAPDEGAATRAAYFRRYVFPNAALIQCSKTRDSNTGMITSYSLPEIKGKLPYGRYVVVDDICDGGATFNLLANSLFPQLCRSVEGPFALELMVTHGIFSKVWMR